MVKKAKILEPIGEGFEDVVETIVKKDEKNPKKDNIPKTYYLENNLDELAKQGKYLICI